MRGRPRAVPDPGGLLIALARNRGKRLRSGALAQGGRVEPRRDKLAPEAPRRRCARASPRRGQSRKSAGSLPGHRAPRPARHRKDHTKWQARGLEHRQGRPGLLAFRRRIERRKNLSRKRPIDQSAKEARLPLGSCAKPKTFLPDPPMCHPSISAWAERNHQPHPIASAEKHLRTGLETSWYDCAIARRYLRGASPVSPRSTRSSSPSRARPETPPRRRARSYRARWRPWPPSRAPWRGFCRARRA
jgi:hypothetical protein